MRWLFLAVIINLAGALFLRVTAIGEFDPNVLPPASAGLPLQGPEYIAEPSPGNRINCDELHYRVSVDALRYVRESRRGMLEVASIADNFGVYSIDNGADRVTKARAGLEPESDGIITFALYNCDGEYIPSDSFPPGAGPARMAHNARPLYGEIRGDIMVYYRYPDQTVAPLQHGAFYIQANRKIASDPSRQNSMHLSFNKYITDRYRIFLEYA